MTKRDFIPIHHNAIDITGRRFGRLVALGQVLRRPARWLCECDCGNESIVSYGHLTETHKPIKSCGCITKDRLTVHGLTAHKDYGIWKAMRQRCNNHRYPRYSDYGGRGITICASWDDFAVFIHDMGDRPTPKHSIERRNNDGNYSPENCKWATLTEQARNTRRSRILTLNGVSMTVPEWAEKLGVNKGSIHSRIKYGWPEHKILTKPFK